LRLSALMLDLTRGFLPPANVLGGHLKGLEQSRPLWPGAFVGVINLTLARDEGVVWDLELLSSSSSTSLSGMLLLTGRPAWLRTCSRNLVRWLLRGRVGWFRCLLRNRFGWFRCFASWSAFTRGRDPNLFRLRINKVRRSSFEGGTVLVGAGVGLTKGWVGLNEGSLGLKLFCEGLNLLVGSVASMMGREGLNCKVRSVVLSAPVFLKGGLKKGLGLVSGNLKVDSVVSKLGRVGLNSWKVLSVVLSKS